MTTCRLEVQTEERILQFLKYVPLKNYKIYNMAVLT